MSGAVRKPFQEATVQAALARLRDARGSRRFLVADEVGLGKTLVARGVIEGMAAQAATRKRPVRVFYVCSSLSIAHQNTRQLLEWLPEQERAAAEIEVDRLSLVPAQERPSRQAPFHLYRLTPATSVRTRGTGRVRERVLIGRAIQEICGLRASKWFHTALRDNASDQRWRASWDGTEWPARAGAYLKRFRRRMCQLLGLKEQSWKSTLAAEIEQRLREEETRRATLGLLRQAMTLAVIDALAPDLVIFDEFQRFFDVLMAEEDDADAPGAADPDDDRSEEAHHVLRAMLAAEGSDAAGPDQRPAVLLLSATPYRSFARLREGELHHEELFRLLGFLFAEARARNLDALRRDFAAYRHALVRGRIGSTDVLAVKRRIEARLRRVMARTERGILAPRLREGRASRRIGRRESPVEVQDLHLFRHFACCVNQADQAAVAAYWSSIPYPLQMGADYVASKRADLGRARALGRRVGLDRSRIQDYRHADSPHPKLRALLDCLPADLLALPWLPPARPWWPLGAPFAAVAGATKALVFSRFRAVPRALATLLSYEAERRAFGVGVRGKPYDYFLNRSKRPGKENEARLLRRLPAEAFSFGGSPGQDRRLLLMFLPLPALAALGDPLGIAGIDSGQLTRDQARARVRARLVAALGEDETRAGRGNPLAWALALERRAGGAGQAFRAAMEDWLETGGAAHRRVARALREAFAAAEPAGAPGAAELDALADVALTAPGMVLYRAVQRVLGNPEDAVARLRRSWRIGWEALRHYLDSAEWHVLLRRSGAPSSHPDAVRDAVWSGNLESVLDEYLVTMQGLGTAAPAGDREDEVLGKLEQVLRVRRVSLHVDRLRDDGRSMGLRCHAVLPFGLRASTEEGDVMRGEHVREAFNSPFRPMALVTTSIGQEGLDFHRYCRHVVHWDLPGNPVDLEQREGRVDRHGGLAVRRALAGTIITLPRDRSPWHRLAEQLRAQETAGGLVPWWHVDDAEILRTAVMPCVSEQADRLAALEADLALYRYALGQPDQEALMVALARRLDEEGEKSAQERARLHAWLQAAALDLCPLPRAQRVPQE